MASDFDAPLSAPPPFKAWQRWALLAAFALLVVFRLPHAWAHGRFQDEEATVFLAYAWHFPWTEALLRPFGGYLNLGANVPAVLAVELVRSGILPLERAPYLTMSFALAFQLLPAVLILTGKAQWLASRAAVIAALLLVAIVPASEEVFFNTLHIQFQLALCVALILSLEVPASRAARLGYGVILFLAPLCGPGAIIILPLFALRTAVDRDRGRLAQLATLAAGAAVQLLLFYGSSPFREHGAESRTIAAAMFVRLIAFPLTGIDLTNWVANWITASALLAWVAAAATIIIFGTWVGIEAWRRESTVWLILAALALAAVSTAFGLFSVNPKDLFNVLMGERYNFVPLALLGMSLVAKAARAGPRTRPAWIALCLLVLLNGAIQYPKPVSQFADGPDWTAEVQAWRANHDHPLAVWPRPWTADLSDHARACSATTADLARSNDPRYCESGWIAAFYRRK